MRLNKVGRVVLALTAAGSLSACVGPKVVRQITGNEKNIKFVYNQKGKDESGVIKCEVGEKGKLQKCVDMPIQFVEEEGE